MWLVGVGGIYGCGYGCGFKEIYRFPHTPLVSVLFAAASDPYFLFIFLKCFSFLFQYFF